MSKLSIFKIEDISTDEYNAVRVECFPGEDPEDAVISFRKSVFENAQGLLYKRLKSKLGDEDEWEANDELTDCVLVGGVAERVMVKPHYRFTRDKKGNLVKANPERIVKFLKVVAFTGETVEGEVARYEAQIPDSCKIDDNEE